VVKKRKKTKTELATCLTPTTFSSLLLGLRESPATTQPQSDGGVRQAQLSPALFASVYTLTPSALSLM
jgi:hypothetical protein